MLSFGLTVDMLSKETRERCSQVRTINNPLVLPPRKLHPTLLFEFRQELLENLLVIQNLPDVKYDLQLVSIP